MLYSNSTVSTVQTNRKQTQTSLRFQPENRSNTSTPQKLGPKLSLTRAGERRVRVQQARNLWRDMLLLAVAIATTGWAFSYLLL